MRFQRQNGKAAKVTPGQVVEMRDKYAAGATQGQLAREYGISVGQIGRIVRQESWLQLPERSATSGEIALSAQRMMEEQIRVQREREANINPDNMLKELTNERRNEESAGIPPNPLDER